jgi:adenosine deaminase
MAKSANWLIQKDIMRHFPKVELHRHLEGTFSVPTLFRIARDNEIGLSDDFETFKSQVQFPRDSEPDFLEFLSKFRNDWYRSKKDIQDIVYDSVYEMKNDGMFYCELRFSPEHFSFFNDYDRLDITKLVIHTANQAATDAGFIVRYLLTFNRGKQDQNGMLKLYNQICKLRLPEIVGIDLAGDEKNFPPELFPDFFKKVKEDGKFGITIHAGEVTPSQQIWYAIENLHADRIGHGVSAIYDKEIQKELIKRNVSLEQCITSNFQTNSWADEKNHPFGRLYKAGVPVTLNSDDPFIQDTDLTDDYIKAITYFKLKLDDLVKINHTAIQTSFLSDSEKRQLTSAYDAQIEEFIKKHVPATDKANKKLNKKTKASSKKA